MTKIINIKAIAYITYADFIQVFIFVNAAKKNTQNPSTILVSCDNANGRHAPPPAEYSTTMDIANIKHIGINIAHEKRPSFSEKLIILAFETRVCRAIVYFLSPNSARIVAATVRTAGPAPPECSVIAHTAYLGLFVGAYPINKP